jgi:hypothetical protein
MSFNIITYPRSGRTLLRSLLRQQGYNNNASHSINYFKDNLSIVTIARNPVDSVSSNFAMTNFYNKPDVSEVVFSNVDVYLKEYTDYYRWFIDNAAYVISYDNLVQNPKGTMERVFNNFSMPYKNINYDLTLNQDDTRKKHLLTSVVVSFYDKVKTQVLESKHLPEALEAYQQLLFSQWVRGS